MSRLPALPQRPTRSIVAHEPECGFWEFRVVDGGPLLPASISRIYYEPSNPTNELDTAFGPVPTLIANVGYRAMDPLRVWTGRRMRRLTEVEYEKFMEQIAWDREYGDPSSPVLHPTKRVNLGELKPVGPDE